MSENERQELPPESPIFTGADRAPGYAEPAGPPPVQQYQPPVEQQYQQSPAQQRPAPEHYAQLPQIQQQPQSRRQRRQPPAEQPPPPAPVLDVEAMSKDLSGSWFTTSRENTEQQAPARAKRGARGLLARIGLPIAPSEAEQAALAAEASLAAAERTVRQATWTRCVTILVAQRKGGAGKTPAAIALGGELAHIRGGGVVIPEVSDDPGMIALRSEGSPRRGLGELMDAVGTIHSAGQLAGYTAPQTSHAAVIGSPTPRRGLTGDDVRSIHQLLSIHYAIQVLDSGNVYSSSAFGAAVEVADALVIPVTDAADSMQDALALVHHLSQSEHGRHLVANATVLRLRYVDAGPQIVERVDAALRGLGVARVIDVPNDQHIAEHGEITLSKLQPATRAAFLHAAATVVQSLHTLESR